MIIYSFGFFLIFLTFFLLHFHAYRMRDLLELDEIELVQTYGRIRSSFTSMGIALASITISVVWGGSASTIAGMVYGLMGPAHGVNGYFVGRRMSELTEFTRDS
jgi:hypothetical protein